MTRATVKNSDELHHIWDFSVFFGGRSQNQDFLRKTAILFQYISCQTAQPGKTNANQGDPKKWAEFINGLG